MQKKHCTFVVNAKKKIWNWISCKIFWKLFTKEFFELFMVSDLILNVFLFIITIIMHMRVLVHYILWYQEINHNKHRANSQPNDFKKITSIYIFFNILYWKKWESSGYTDLVSYLLLQSNKSSGTGLGIALGCAFDFCWHCTPNIWLSFFSWFFLS